jgi:D-alanine-D-alanine ligase
MDGNSLFLGRRVALLCGGDSAEREISLASGGQVEAALLEAGYEPALIDPADIDLSAMNWAMFDVCFIALHGGAGEDGRIQLQLEEHRVPYTGSGPAASRLAMNKSAAKQRFVQCSVPSLPQVVLSADEIRTDRGDVSIGSAGVLQQKLASFGFPLVIKPESQGSSLGVCAAADRDELAQCLTNAAQFDDYVIAEPYVAGREFTISLLGRDPLPMVEIIAPRRVFSYEAKYTSAETEYRTDCRLRAEIESRLYRAAIAATEVLGTRGLVRVDLMLDQNEQPWVLEVNTIPGMTARSLSPRAARAAGIEMPALVDWMVRDALATCGKPTVSMPAKSFEFGVSR